jgi:hypothetical protein
LATGGFADLGGQEEGDFRAVLQLAGGALDVVGAISAIWAGS